MTLNNKLVCFLGHSYVYHLSLLGKYADNFDDGEPYTIKYFGYPGATYEIFTMNNGKNLTPVIVTVPDIVVVALAGNSVATLTEVPCERDYEECCVFYDMLRKQLPSHTKIIAVQMEARYYHHKNEKVHKEYMRYRMYFNKFLKKLVSKDCLAQVSGKGRLDDPKYYDNNVHLNQEGKEKYYSLIKGAVNFCYEYYIKKIPSQSVAVIVNKDIADANQDNSIVNNENTSDEKKDIINILVSMNEEEKRDSSKISVSMDEEEKIDNSNIPVSMDEEEKIDISNIPVSMNEEEKIDISNIPVSANEEKS